MKKRTISNKGLDQPIVDQNGTPLAGVPIEFTLVTANKIPTATVDAITHEFVVCRKKQIVTTGTEDGATPGEMEVELWPTSRGAEQVFYLCSIPSLGLSFVSPLMDGDDPISWAEFRTSGTLLAASELVNGGFVAHLQDASRHLSADERAALSAANNPSAINPFATIGDIEFAGGHVHTNLDVLDDLSDLDGVLQYKGQPIQGGGGGSVSAVTAAGGELVGAYVVDGMLEWRVIGQGSGGADTFLAATGETLQAFVTNGDEGAKYVEWRSL